MQNILHQLMDEYKPRFPATFPREFNPGVGIAGCGKIVQMQHLPAYKKYGIRVNGVYDIIPEVAEKVQQEWNIRRRYQSLEELLSDTEIAVVDIATHPDVRFPLVKQAIEAGKHVLVQKPLACTVEEAQQLIQLADQRGVVLAVNQNGRWSPAWRLATLLIEQGVVGEVLAVTHLFETSFRWTIGTKFDDIPQFVLYDYGIHWIDITRCWMGTAPLDTVRAELFRLPIQPPESKTPWGAWIEFRWKTGQTALIRSIGGANVTRRKHPFWIHGTEGTLRGTVMDQEYLELEKNRTVTVFHLEGNWYPDGFGGTIGELFSAIHEKREPYNSAKHNILSLQMTLSACESASAGGKVIQFSKNP